MPVGSPRPKQKEFLGSRLCSYIQKNKERGCYDADFDKAIRIKHPNWFVDTVAENKKKLLALPIGSPKPRQKIDMLGTVLSNYIYKTSSQYDPKFAKAIKKRQPAWFKF